MPFKLGDNKAPRSRRYRIADTSKIKYINCENLLYFSGCFLSNHPPFTPKLTYGFIAGWCSGMALKKVGQVAATVLGLGFVSLQTLQYYGYIEISHDKFKSTVEDALDLNNDGKVDKSDIQASFDRLMGVLTYNGMFESFFSLK